MAAPVTGRLVLHVGDFKTGSTSIQTCLRQGRYDSDLRICYPGTAPSHSHLIPKVRPDKWQAAQMALFDALTAEIAQADADVTVLSAEHFQMLRPGRLRRWLETFLPDHAATAQVICYVRPHAEFLTSTWAEQTKLGVNALPLEQFIPAFLERRAMRFWPRFRRWQGVFGENFVLRPMIRAHLRDGDVVADFMYHALGAGAVRLQGQTRANIALPLEDVEFMRRFHARLRAMRIALPAGRRNGLGNRMQALLQARPLPEGHKITLTAAELAQVTARCAEDAAQMDAAFFTGNPLSEALAAATARTAPRPDVSRRPQWRQLRALAALPPALLGRRIGG